MPIKISLPVEADARGFVDRQCQRCSFFFKVDEEAWERACRGPDRAHCPRCRHSDVADAWVSAAHSKHLHAMARNAALNIFQDHMRESFRDMNRRASSSSGALRVSVKFHGSPRKPTNLPLPVADPLRLEVSCEVCSVKFAVVGAAFFCPGCGANLVERMFDDALAKVRLKIELAAKLRAGTTTVGTRDDDENLARGQLESALQDGVTAYQAFAEKRYLALTPTPPDPPKNVFQRLAQGSALWKAATNHSYEDWLSGPQLARLNILLHRRHVLVHQDGIVDDAYLLKSGDTSYVEGQRLVVAADDVLELVDLFAALAAGIRSL